MNATLVSLLVSVITLALNHMYPGLGIAMTLPKVPLLILLGFFLIFSLLPWKWVRSMRGGDSSRETVQHILKAQIGDRTTGYCLNIVYLLVFCAAIVISCDKIPPIFRYVYTLVSIGILIDLIKTMYRQIVYRSHALGLAEWLINVMEKAEKNSNKEAILEAFENTFSIILGYLKQGDLASLRIFCLSIFDHADTWIRCSAQLPGKFDGVSQESSVLDCYTIVEAMVAKRLSAISKKSVLDGDLLGFEILVWFQGKLSLAFHKKFNSLGYLILLSLSSALQQAEGKIDRTSREIEYISMLSEVIKSYIDYAASIKTSDRAAILRMLSLLENHLKNSFQADRNINPAFLMQPLAEVGQLLSGEAYSMMSDRNDIIAELRRLLAQFAALESVRGEMDIGVEGTDTKASYHEDKPFLANR